MVHGKGLEYVRIDGSTIASDRQKAVDAFQAKDEVFLLVALIISLSYLTCVKFSVQFIFHCFRVLILSIYFAGEDCDHRINCWGCRT